MFDFSVFYIFTFCSLIRNICCNAGQLWTRGDADDCVSTSEAAEQAAKLAEETIENLAVPGEVEFINGGPPCVVHYFAEHM